jgi:hypothetical protein
MGRLRFFGQEEVDIQLRTERGSSPRRLVPWWARAASGKHSVGNAPAAPRPSLRQMLASTTYGAPQFLAAERGEVFLSQSEERSVGRPRTVPVAPWSPAGNRKRTRV